MWSDVFFTFSFFSDFSVFIDFIVLIEFIVLIDFIEFITFITFFEVFWTNFLVQNGGVLLVVCFISHVFVQK